MEEKENYSPQRYFQISFTPKSNKSKVFETCSTPESAKVVDSPLRLAELAVRHDKRRRPEVACVLSPEEQPSEATLGRHPQLMGDDEPPLVHD